MNSDTAAKTGRGAAWKSGLVFFRINWISCTFIPLLKGYFVNSSNCDFSRHFYANNGGEIMTTQYWVVLRNTYISLGFLEQWKRSKY